MHALEEALYDELLGDTMSKAITRLVLDIDLRCYAEDARFTIAKHLINRAVNTALITEDDLASFLNEEETEGMLFKVEEITVTR
jgi:hypothetical protein